MPSRISVVIPALNEVEGLPRLLGQLQRQTRRPAEIIVADAGSTDGTRIIASEAGATVVDGGRPAAGRNAGARAASGDIVLFLDADVDLDDTTVQTLAEEFERRSLSAGTAHIEPIERTPENLFACEVANLYLDVMQVVSPHAPGFCIMIERAVHEAIGGFDESLALAEDHDYVQRASVLGKFRVMQDAPVRTSMRRIEKEGLISLAFKYVYCEIFVLAGKPITKTPFDYEFSAFEAQAAQPRLTAEAFRDWMGDAARAVAALPVEAFDTLAELGRSEPSAPEHIERLLARLPEPDVERIRHYVEARVRLARMKRVSALRRFRAAGDRVWTELTRFER